MRRSQRNLLVFSVALEGFDQLFSDCIRTQREYCRRFQYRYVLARQAPRRLTRDEAAWLKVPLIQAGLAAGYEWVAFLDADCEVRSHTPEFPAYLQKFPESRTIYMAPGFSGRINSGVIFARNAVASSGFFDLLMANANSEVPAPEDRVGWGENGHFIYYGKNNSAVQLLDHDLWNNNSHLDEQSYIQHYVRGPMRDRYLANRVHPKGEEGALSKLMTRVQGMFTRRPDQDSQEPNSPVIISESMKELVPYYLKKYPAFRRV